MAYFTVDRARSIIRDTYTAAAADVPAVASGPYAADELAGRPGVPSAWPSASVTRCGTLA